MAPETRENAATAWAKEGVPLCSKSPSGQAGLPEVVGLDALVAEEPKEQQASAPALEPLPALEPGAAVKKNPVDGKKP
jgi:hypothetical protein